MNAEEIAESVSDGINELISAHASRQAADAQVLQRLVNALEAIRTPGTVLTSLAPSQDLIDAVCVLVEDARTKTLAPVVRQAVIEMVCKGLQCPIP